MRQSKHQYDEIIRSIEENGAARERVAQAKRQACISNQLIRVRAAILRLEHMLDMDSDSSPEKPQPKKRKAVEASDTDIQLVREIFDAYEGPLLPHHIAKHCSLGVRRIGRACEALRKLREIDGGNGGYRLVRKENGLDGTAETRL